MEISVFNLMNGCNYDSEKSTDGQCLQREDTVLRAKCWENLYFSGEGAKEAGREIQRRKGWRRT